MTRKKICLASDNWTAAHPLVMQAVVEANESYSPAYGTDPWTEESQKLIQKAFKRDCKVYMVPTGTGANMFAYRLGCRSYESVICTDNAHTNSAECGAAEAMVGCKLLTVPHHEGKITPKELLRKLKDERSSGIHSTSPRVLSIAQSTELGTVYTLDELRALSQICKEEKLYFHIDGSRLYNAATYLKVSLDKFAEFPDILSLGGTKNGLMGAESLVIFNPALFEGSNYLQKQMLQLLSKQRYLSVQYHPFFKNNLWETLAKQANQKAAEIAEILKAAPGVTINYPVQTNQIFFTVPATWIPLIQEEIFCHLWDYEINEIRFVTSWNTTDEDVKELTRVFKNLSSNLQVLDSNARQICDGNLAVR